VATIVATRVLSPRSAVAWAAFFNFVAFVIIPLKVANAIAKDVVNPASNVLTIGVVFAGLIGAVAWNLITAWLGLPTSSSHALVGGMAGAAMARAGGHVLVIDGIRRILVFIVLAPLLGLALAFTLSILIMWLTHRTTRVSGLNKLFRRLQLVSAAAYSLGHGGNDAQKTMGIIFALLIATGHAGAKAEIPLWVVLACHAAIALGTLTGGWRIVKTMGMKLTRLQPVGGVAAETSAAAALFFASANGIPVSTTHTIAGAIVGVGSANRMSAVRWNVARRVVWAWLLTIPGAAVMAALTSWIVHVVA
jgi:PiT family inorganic phosphate transporter